MDDRSTSNDAGDSTGRGDDLGRGLAEAYDACADGLFRYATMLLADPAAAEDAVHQVFAKLAAMGERRVAEIETVKAYLRRAVRNECYRLLKRRSRRKVTDLLPLLETAAPDEPAYGQELREALERALRALPPKQREVVHMKVYEKGTFRQIAERLAISANTAASRYRYALSRLRDALGPHGGRQE